MVTMSCSARRSRPLGCGHSSGQTRPLPFAPIRGRVHVVFRGRIGPRVGDTDLVVDEGGFLFKPRDIVRAIWNPTDVEGPGPNCPATMTIYRPPSRLVRLPQMTF